MASPSAATLFVICVLVVSTAVQRASAETTPVGAVAWVDGRHVTLADQSVQFDWSLVSVTLCLPPQSQGISLYACDTGTNQFDVLADGVLVLRLNLTQACHTYDIHIPADTFSGNLQLVKRTEAFVGTVTLRSVRAVPDAPLRACAAPERTRHMEVLGDSLSCAYGAEGIPPCAYTPSTQNARVSFQALAALAFSADLHLQCWSGTGVVRNYGDPSRTSSTPFPALYPRTIANDSASVWDFNMYSPELTVVELGDNDYSTDPVPYDSVFEQGYLNLLSLLRTKYGVKMWIVVVCGINPRAPCTQIQYVVNKQMASGDKRIAYVDLHVLTEPTDFGCASHPSVQGHEKMAAKLIDTIKSTGVWS